MHAIIAVWFLMVSTDYDPKVHALASYNTETACIRASILVLHEEGTKFVWCQPAKVTTMGVKYER